MKPFRGKRRGPQRLPVGFSLWHGRIGWRRRIRKERVGRSPRPGRWCTSGERSATTGSSAVRSLRERWRCERSLPRYRPGRRWPVGGPRKTRAVASGSRRLVRPFSTGGDCCQCPPTAGVRWRRRSRPTRGRWRIGRLPVRPVLKHGPRSLTCARVAGRYETQRAK